jgi:hypothetical protein
MPRLLCSQSTPTPQQVIGVQECQILRELREAIVEHLGGPQAYTFFGQDIGSEMVLRGRIAVTLFVRTADVAAGRFKMHQGVVDRVAAGVCGERAPVGYSTLH